MIWMKIFCFCCSVRLGVIVCGIVSILHAIASICILVILGPPILRSSKQLISREDRVDGDSFLWKMMDGLAKDSSAYLACFESMLVAHILDSLSAIYGAVKLRKWFIVPYVVSQSLMALVGMTQHVLSMMIVKNVVSLEILIGSTLLGGFFMLFLAYSGVTAVSLFQIITLVNSPEYKSLYGCDPLAPIWNSRDPENCRRRINDVRIFYIPNKRQINCVKEMICKQREGQLVVPVKPVMSVKPSLVQEKDDVQDVNFSDWHLNEVVCERKDIK